MSLLSGDAETGRRREGLLRRWLLAFIKEKKKCRLCLHETGRHGNHSSSLLEYTARLIHTKDGKTPLILITTGGVSPKKPLDRRPFRL